MVVEVVVEEEEEERHPEMLLEVVEQVTHKVEEEEMFSRICPRRRPRRQSRRPSQLLGILHLKSGKLKNYLNVVNNFTVVNFASSHDIFISLYLCLSDLMDKEICFLVGQVFQSPELNGKLFTFCKFFVHLNMSSCCA